MKTRLRFQCWSCKRNYSLTKEITDQQILIVPCPYCNAKAIVKLDPYKVAKTHVLKGEPAEQAPEYDYVFPEVVPTEEPE